MKSTCELLNNQLGLIVIRDPIKSLYNPKLEFISVGDNRFRLSMKIDTFDARSGNRIFQIEANGMTNAYIVGRFIRDLHFLGKYVFKCLNDYMHHELAESLLINNEFIVSPEHWGPDDS